MEVVFIDPEPPDMTGGGIRTYIRLAVRICRDAGHTARVYTHDPSAYHGEAGTVGVAVSPIGRRPWLRRPLLGLAYRLGYAANVLWEHAYWLEAELSNGDAPGRIYEFADFQGYGFFALRNRRLRDRCLVRVHTPNFLVTERPTALLQSLAWRLAAWRESDSMIRTRHLTVPSAEFIREKLPWLRGWTHVPNPLPPATALAAMAGSPGGARVSAKNQAKPGHPHSGTGVSQSAMELPAGGDSGWTSAAEDPKIAAERNAPRPTRIEPERFLYLGRVEERKGVLILVRAFMRLAAEKPYATLTLVGSATAGPYSESVRALIESLPSGLRHRVAWESPCTPEQRPALFRRFTALTAPSLWENSPYVYFEAMAAGLPCLGSATGEMKAIAAITGAMTAMPGDEDDWLRILRAHCDGVDASLPEAQAAYLEEQRISIPGRLLAAWVAAAADLGTEAA